jgi:BRCT domain type II-containing protein
MGKRDPEDELSETGSEGDTDKTAVENTRKKAKPSPSKSKSTTPSPSKSSRPSSSTFQSSSSSQSAKSKLAEMIIECGIKNFSRPEAQIRVSISSPHHPMSRLTRQTGLTPAQQAEMLKPGRGSLRKGFMAYVEKL